MIYWDGMVRIATSIENPSLSRFRILLMSWYAVRRFAGDGFFLWKIMDRKVFIKSCYDVKNYESRRRDPTFCFIWRKSKFNLWSFFVSLSLSLQAFLMGKFWGEITPPVLLIKNTQSLNPWCVYVWKHIKRSRGWAGKLSTDWVLRGVAVM